MLFRDIIRLRNPEGRLYVKIIFSCHLIINSVRLIVNDVWLILFVYEKQGNIKYDSQNDSRCVDF
jgi:hypothetical protein